MKDGKMRSREQPGAALADTANFKVGRWRWEAKGESGLWKLDKADAGAGPEPPQARCWHEAGRVSSFRVLQLEELDETSMPS